MTPFHDVIRQLELNRIGTVRRSDLPDRWMRKLRITLREAAVSRNPPEMVQSGSESS